MLICFQHLSEPNVATQQWVRFTQLAHQRFVHPGPLVLGTDPLKFLRLQQIRTELSHDVLNPARVPF